MKIALLTPTFSHFSGIDRVVELDAEKYAKKGHKVAIFTLRALIKPKKVKLVELGMPKNPTLERVYRLFFFLDRKKIKKSTEMLKEFDIIKCYFYPMSWLAYYVKKKNKKLKYIYWNAGIAYPELFKNFYERVYLKLFLIFLKKTLKNVDECISISKFMKSELRRQIGFDSKVEYVDIDKKRFHKGIDSNRIRKRYSLKKEPLLLYVGRLSPHKGLHLLIEAFNLVLKKIPEARLIIAGKPTFDDYFDKLKSMSNKNVIFAGFVPDEELPYYYAACDLYVTASLWEGYDMPVVEAQYCGKKVVAFDCCSHPEVVKEGILVREGKIKEFANSILKVLKKN